MVCSDKTAYQYLFFRADQSVQRHQDATLPQQYNGQFDNTAIQLSAVPRQDHQSPHRRQLLACKASLGANLLASSLQPRFLTPLNDVAKYATPSFLTAKAAQQRQLSLGERM